MYLLDTNVCIQYLTGRSEPIVQRLSSMRPSLIRLCSVVKSELLFGAAKFNNKEKALMHLAFFFAPYQSLPFDDECAAQYGILRSYLAKLGTPIGPNDLLNAVIALTHNLILVTHNVSEFARVPGLVIEDWEGA